MRFAVSLTILAINFYAFATAQTGELQVLLQIGALLPAPSMPTALTGEQVLAHRSVSSGDAYPENLSLSLSSAIKRGLEHNLGLLLSEQDTRSAQAARYPTLEVRGDYGTIGPRILDSHGTFTAALSFHLPVFQGGRIRGDVLAADAALQQRLSELENLRARIEYELRVVFLDLQAARDQVKLARSAVEITDEQIKLAEDRFATGLASNIDLVLAQEAFATADENHISCLYAYNLAKVALARASGGAESSALQYLGLTAN